MNVSKPAATKVPTSRSVSLTVLPPGYFPASNRSGTTQYDSARGLRRLGIEAGEIEHFGVGQVRRLDIAQRREDRFGPPGELPFPLGQHPLDLLTLRVVLGTAQLARDDRELTGSRKTLDLRLGHIGQRPDHDVTTVLRLELGRHGLETAAE